MIGLALLAPLSSFAEENGANKKKPNIIYILACLLYTSDAADEL